MGQWRPNRREIHGLMPFSLSVFLFSYSIWMASIERAFSYNSVEMRR
jgi:hypothetical protein